MKDEIFHINLSQIPNLTDFRYIRRVNVSKVYEFQFNLLKSVTGYNVFKFPNSLEQEIVSFSQDMIDSARENKFYDNDPYTFPFEDILEVGNNLFQRIMDNPITRIHRHFMKR